VKVANITSASPQYRGAHHNRIWIHLEPEGEIEKALMRTLAAHVGHVNVYSDGTLSIQFKPPRRKDFVTTSRRPLQGI
jgi:hypothetical protein